MRKWLIIALLLLQTNLWVKAATFQLAPVFSDHMVLQRNAPIAIWGIGKPGEKVTIQLSKESKSAVIDQNGKWRIVLKPRKAGGPFVLKAAVKDSAILVQDILIGDVWLCSGQSNMDFRLKEAKTGKEELKAKLFNPSIRLLKYAGAAPTNKEPWDAATLEKVDQYQFYNGIWQTVDETSAADFSAVGYYFGKKIAFEIGVPVGLIQVALGGSPTESWIERKVLEMNPQLKGIVNDWEHTPLVMDWCRQRASENIGKSDSKIHPFQPGYNFKAGIEPLITFPIKGVIWYQGESNAHDVAGHALLFTTLVNSWRKAWGYTFPFYFVQLSSIQRETWPEFRDSQRRLAQKIKKTGMAVTHDLGDSLDVHPLRKKEVGERLALLALHDAYGKSESGQGPELLKVTRSKNVLDLEFKSAKILRTLDKKPLTGFEIMTSSGQKIAVNGVIDGNHIRIVLPTEEPVSKVLYAFQPFSRANLTNEVGLPASTFSIIIP